MKVLPFEFEIDLKSGSPIATNRNSDSATRPFCFPRAGAGVSAGKLFDAAGLVRAPFSGAELYWQFSVSVSRLCFCWFCFWPWPMR